MSGMSEWLLILLIVLVLFGGSQIPKLAKSIGKARKDFEDGYKDGSEEKSDSDSVDKESQPAEGAKTEKSGDKTE